MKLKHYPNIEVALRLVADDNGMGLARRLKEAQFPAPWIPADLQLAEEAAARMKGKPLSSLVPAEMLGFPEKLAEPKDDALETLCCGEATIQELLVLETGRGGELLHKLLGAAFDGDLHDVFYRES